MMNERDYEGKGRFSGKLFQDQTTTEKLDHDFYTTGDEALVLQSLLVVEKSLKVTAILWYLY
jgi:hypothetical protein